MHNNKTSSQRYYDEKYEKLLSDESPFAVREAYNAIRANLLFAGKGDKCSTFAITGANENSGKTLSCINIAISFARMGKRVLIIDADLRNSSIHKGLAIRTKEGMSEALANLIKEIPIVNTDIENLSIIPAGHTPPNPAELLFSSRFEEIKEACEADFDYIFVDTPPINVVSDALMLAKKVDGFIFVARAGKDSTQSVKAAVDSLKKVNGKVLGFVLNDVNMKTQGYKGEYSHYGYGYGYGSKYGSKYETQNKEGKHE